MENNNEEPSPSPSINSEASLSKPHNLKPEDYAKGLDQEHIGRLTEEAYKHFLTYTKAELKTTVEDCQLLEAMNKNTKEKYTQMSQMSQRLMKEMSKLQNTYADFTNFIEQIDDIHEQVLKMESTAKALDEYSRYLENKLAKVNAAR